MSENTNEVSLEGLDKGAVLAALYNNSRPLGLGFLHYTPELMSADEGNELLKKQKYFDYLRGRVMKIDLGGETLNTWLYNRDNGDGAAEKVIEELRANKSSAE